MSMQNFKANPIFAFLSPCLLFVGMTESKSQIDDFSSQEMKKLFLSYEDKT